MKIKFNKNAATISVYNGDEENTLKIKKCSPSHSFERWAIFLNGKKLASLGNGGSYGWIIGETDDPVFSREVINQIARKAQKSHFNYLWDQLQTW